MQYPIFATSFAVGESVFTALNVSTSFSDDSA
jgi:hypothetical protein